MNELGTHRLILTLEQDGTIATTQLKYAPHSEAATSWHLIQSLPDDAPEAWLKAIEPEVILDVAEHTNSTEYLRCKLY